MIDSLLRKLEIPENDLPYYQYGIVSLLELISVQFLCILWAAFRHQIIDYLIFYLIFLILRKYGGGFHFKDFLPCFITSVISIIGTDAAHISWDISVCTYQFIFSGTNHSDISCSKRGGDSFQKGIPIT